MRRLRGTAEIEVTGASKELCFNRWTATELPFWKLRVDSELCFRCWVYEAQLPQVRREAARAWCEVRVLRRRGLPQILRRMRVRPVLTAGFLLAVLTAYCLQGFVWFFQIRGNQRVSTETILQALAEEGVTFGTWGLSIESEDLKNRILNRIPELRWLAANQEGGVLRVLVAERTQEEPMEETGGAAHLVAARTGIVRELRVINGFAAVAPGDLVYPGSILISGLMDWTTHTQATRAAGEVTADTLRIVETLCPEMTLQKTYTGREETCLTLIIERNRRKISGNSGIFGTMCDRMVETETWTLPGGFALPVTVEKVTLREYALEPRTLDSEEADALLERESLRLVEAELVAGTVEAGSATTQKTGNSYRCRGVWNCLEVISVTRPLELFGKEEGNGEADQRGTH